MADTKKDTDDIDLLDFMVSEYHFEDPYTPDRDPREGAQFLLYLTYSLTVVMAGLLLLTSAVPAFIIPVFFCFGFCLINIYYQIFLSPNIYYRPHYRYCFKTLFIGEMISLCTMAILLGLYWLGIKDTQENLSEPQTQIFEHHSYLFWVFLPNFVFASLRAFRGWNNVISARMNVFNEAFHGPDSLAESRLFIVSYMLVLIACPLLFISEWSAAMIATSILVMVIILGTAGYLGNKSKPFRNGYTHVLVTMGVSFLLMMFCAVLVYFAQEAAVKISYVFAWSAISEEALNASYDLVVGLEKIEYHLIFSFAALFLLYRSLDMFGIFSRSGR